MKPEDGARSCERSTRALFPFERNQHIHVACTLLPESEQRLIFRRGIPSIESVHVRKFDYDYTVGPPAFRKFVRRRPANFNRAIGGGDDLSHLITHP